MKSIVALMFVCGMLLSVSVTSCDTSKATDENSTEEAAGEEAGNTEHPAEDAEHPAGDSSEHPAGEHPKSDSTDVKEAAQ